MAILTFHAPVWAQDDGPIIVGPNRDWQTVRFDPVRFTLDLYARRQDDRIKLNDGTSQRDTENMFQQSLTMSTSGFAGHPNLFQFDLSGTVGLIERYEKFDSVGRDEESIESLLEYDLNALILAQSETPWTVYSRRSQTTLNRQFGGSLDSVITEHGAGMVWRSTHAPTTLRYFHREEEQTSNSSFFGGASGFNLVQDTFQWQTLFQPDPQQQLNWEYTFDNVTESIPSSGFTGLRPTTSFQRHNALATHLLDFGPDAKHNLRSTILLFSQIGDFPLNRVRLDEALRLRHTPRFETLYNYNFDWQQRSASAFSPESDQMFHQGTVGLRHRLFESLITSADFGANHISISPGSGGDFTSYQIFGNLRFDYHKKVPLGRLSASLFGSAHEQHNSENGVPIQIVNEQQAFGPTGVLIVNRRNIDPNSIRITDPTGLITYAPGADYVVNVFGNQAEIRRVLGGDIGDGQSVLLNYQFGPEPGHTITTVGGGTSIRYDIEEGIFKGAGVYARYFHQEQDFSESSDIGGPLSPIAESIDDLVFGADYRIWYLFFGAERQIRDSTLSPFTVNRLDARFTQSLGNRSSLTLYGSYYDIDRTNEDIQTTITVLGGRWSQMVTQRLSMNASIQWRQEDDSLGTDAQGFEQQLDMTWRHRQTTVYGAVRNAFLETDSTDSTFQTFIIGLRREF